MQKLELPDLPYGYDALEPYIDEATMRLHHDKHHRTYVDKANAALEGTALEGEPVDQILTRLDELPEDTRAAVRNNVGGHVNHSLFWTVMGPGESSPSDELAEAIASAFGDEPAFRDAFTTAATSVFGSGWAWLLADAGGLRIATSPNQDSLVSVGDRPILGIDVWEHAYYLKYQNRRPEYLDAWWNTVNWDAVSERYEQARATPTTATRV